MMPSMYGLADRVNSILALRQNISSVTMPTCDMLLRHFRKMLLYMQGYVVAYSLLLSTLVDTH